MHAHLKACIEDYGPIHSFWVFAFERYNGILESLPNNNRCIEPQMMQRFIHDILTLSVNLPEEFHDILNPHLPSTHCSSNRVAGSLADTISPCSDTTTDSWDYQESSMELPSSRYRYLLDTTQVQLLSYLYSKLFNVTPDCIDLPSVCWKYTSITFNGKNLGSFNTRSASSSTILAVWSKKLFGQPAISIVEGFVVMDDKIVRATLINHFLLHRPTIADEDHTVLLMSVSWYKFHHKMSSLGKPLTVWSPDIF